MDRVVSLEEGNHMTSDQDRRLRERAGRCKYQRLYAHLCGLQVQEWKTSFSEIEGILGFLLPNAARDFRPWWANQRDFSGRAQALAWTAAGWKTAQVDMVAETLVFKRINGVEQRRKPTIDEILPVRSVGGWPEGLSLRREDLYEDRV